MKTLTKQDVKDAVIKLDNGLGTTSLEVKTALRQDGFWALQADVSTLLRELVDDDDLFSTFNGNHNQYFSYNVNTPTSVFKTVGVQVPSSFYIGSTTTADEATELISGDSGDWYLFSYTDDKWFTYVKGDVSRNKARAFAKTKYHLPYENIGCSVVK